jgi:transketolase
VGQRGAALHAQWQVGFQEWAGANPERARLLDRLQSRRLPEGWADSLPRWEPGQALATRQASHEVINALAGVIPELWGGSADLGESNLTTIKGGGSFLPTGSSVPTANQYGRNLHFGIREHAMGAILNGITIHGLSRAYGGTFLVFSDYMRGSVRLAAIMGLPTVFVWTHDSIGVGEDGPTHQPVEHLWSLRAVPHFSVARPADANETAQCWAAALEGDGPTGLVLSRQNLPVLTPDPGVPADAARRGAYVFAEAAGGVPEVLLLATGSEVSLALAAREILQEQGIATRCVSMPCLEWFATQPKSYQQEVLPPAVRARVSIEAGTDLGWHKYVGDHGRCMSIEDFGASGTPAKLYERFGFTAQAIAQAARESLAAAAG